MTFGSFRLNTLSVGASASSNYTIAASGGVTSVNEGTTLTYNVTAVVANGTTLYWELNNVTTGPGSLDVTPTIGSITINSNAGSFSVYIPKDAIIEGTETFTIP
jgi:hypothetical protein